MCWTEITWNAPQNRWNVKRPTGPDYHCDIFEDEVQTVGQVGPIDGQPPQTPRTPAPSTEDEDEGSECSNNTIESRAPGNTTEEERLADLAESIHINPPEMTTMTEAREIVIEEPLYIRREIMDKTNRNTGYRGRRIANVVDDEAALQHAMGPDMANPPSGGPETLPELPPI